MAENHVDSEYIYIMYTHNAQLVGVGASAQLVGPDLN